MIDVNPFKRGHNKRRCSRVVNPILTLLSTFLFLLSCASLSAESYSCSPQRTCFSFPGRLPECHSNDTSSISLELNTPFHILNSSGFKWRSKSQVGDILIHRGQLDDSTFIDSHLLLKSLVWRVVITAEHESDLNQVYLLGTCRRLQ